MGEYLLSDEDIILINLLLHPPVEGSVASHEAWKQNIRLLKYHKNSDYDGSFWKELCKPGFISTTFRNQCISYGKALPTERQC